MTNELVVSGRTNVRKLFDCNNSFYCCCCSRGRCQTIKCPFKPIVAQMSLSANKQQQQQQNPWVHFFLQLILSITKSNILQIAGLARHIAIFCCRIADFGNTCFQPMSPSLRTQQRIFYFHKHILFVLFTAFSVPANNFISLCFFFVSISRVIFAGIWKIVTQVRKYWRIITIEYYGTWQQ